MQGTWLGPQTRHRNKRLCRLVRYNTAKNPAALAAGEALAYLP
jgi:hypothetical protein